jgi:preprotein translocase subunit Sec61beta
MSEPIPNPNVTRWAAEVAAAIRDHGAQLQGVSPAALLAALLCVIHKESRGNPEQVNPKSGAAGLTQFLSKEYTDAEKFAPRAHLKKSVAVTVRLLGVLKGRLPEALWARGHGRGWLARYVERDPEAEYQGAYWRSLWSELWPAYSAWVRAWVEAGQPAAEATLTVKGKGERVTLAAWVEPARAGLPSPFEGVWRLPDGRERREGAGVALVQGVKGAAKNKKIAVAGVVIAGAAVSAALIAARSGNQKRRSR